MATVGPDEGLSGSKWTDRDSGGTGVIGCGWLGIWCGLVGLVLVVVGVHPFRLDIVSASSRRPARSTLR